MKKEPARNTDTVQIAHYQDENRALMEDILYIMKHPMESCKMCARRDDPTCKSGVNCDPIWKGVGDR